MLETLLIAAVLYTGWRVLRWVGRTVREVLRLLGVLAGAVAHTLIHPSQAERDQQAIEQLLREVACPTPK